MTHRSALVTGASRGIGEGIASTLASNGWDLTLVARGADRLTEVRESLLAPGDGRVEIAAAGMADPDKNKIAITRHREAFGFRHAKITTGMIQKNILRTLGAAGESKGTAKP